MPTLNDRVELIRQTLAEGGDVKAAVVSLMEIVAELAKRADQDDSDRKAMHDAVASEAASYRR